MQASEPIKKSGFSLNSSIGGNSAMKTNPSQEKPKYEHPAKDNTSVNTGSAEVKNNSENIEASSTTSANQCSQPESNTYKKDKEEAIEPDPNTNSQQPESLNQAAPYTPQTNSPTDNDKQAEAQDSSGKTPPHKPTYVPHSSQDSEPDSNDVRADEDNNEIKETKEKKEIIEEHSYVKGNSILDTTKKYLKKITTKADGDEIEPVGGDINFNEDGFYDDTTNPYQDISFKRHVSDYKTKILVAIAVLAYMVYFIYHFAE